MLNVGKKIKFCLSYIKGMPENEQIIIFSEYKAPLMFLEKKLQEININALTYLTKVFAYDMVKRNKGKILNVASTGAYHPGPYTAVYYATKAYVLSFTEAIAEELKNYDITVSALCPGATKTNFSKNAGKKDNANAMSSEFVAKKAYKGLMKNKSTIKFN